MYVCVVTVFDQFSEGLCFDKNFTCLPFPRTYFSEHTINYGTKRYHFIRKVAEFSDVAQSGGSWKNKI